MSGTEQVEFVLERFLRMEFVAKEQRTLLYSKLSGVFRILQFFIRSVYSDTNPSPLKVLPCNYVM